MFSPGLCASFPNPHREISLGPAAPSGRVLGRVPVGGHGSPGVPWTGQWRALGRLPWLKAGPLLCPGRPRCGPLAPHSPCPRLGRRFPARGRLSAPALSGPAQGALPPPGGALAPRPPRAGGWGAAPGRVGPGRGCRGAHGPGGQHPSPSGSGRPPLLRPPAQRPPVNSWLRGTRTRTASVCA